MGGIRTHAPLVQEARHANHYAAEVAGSRSVLGPFVEVIFVNTGTISCSKSLCQFEPQACNTPCAK